MDRHLVADLEMGHILADLVDNAAGVAAADVEALRLASLVACADHIHGDAQAGPDVVVVDAGRHHVDQHLVVGRVGVSITSTCQAFSGSPKRSGRTSQACILGGT